jgi:hypothetical protein
VTPREMFAPNFTPLAVHDVERAKVLWLSQFGHVGCGGAPIAYVGSGGDRLGCSGCLSTFTAAGPLGWALERTGVFVSLVVKEDA